MPASGPPVSLPHPRPYNADAVLAGVGQLAGNLAHAADGALGNLHVNVCHVGGQLLHDALDVGLVGHVRQHLELLELDEARVGDAAEKRLVLAG